MKIRTTVLPVLRPIGGKSDIESLAKTIKSGWWGRGPKVELLEKRFSKMVGAKFAVAVTSNTMGLDLVLKAYNIKSGNIISPTISFVTTAVVPLWNGCESRLCDIDKKTRNISIEDISSSLDKKTKAVIPINYAGIQTDIPSIRKVYNGIIIEDCALSCYSPGAGSKSDVAIWSFQAVKTISCGDGGIITTNSKKIYDKLKLLINFGIPQDTYQRATKGSSSSILKPGYVWDFNISTIGYKAYMNDIQASLLLSQLDSLSKYLKVRMKIQKKYNEELADEVIRPAWSNTCQFYSASVPSEHRNNLMNYLSTKNIHTTIHFKPLHFHTIFKQKRKFEVAENEWTKFISLPCHSAMKEQDIDYVIYWVNKYFKN